MTRRRREQIEQHLDVLTDLYDHACDRTVQGGFAVQRLEREHALKYAIGLVRAMLDNFDLEPPH